jgi:hypothetical protein
MAKIKIQLGTNSSGGISGVQSVSGQDVDNTDPINPIIGFQKREVKIITDTDPYTILQSDDDKFLTITTEFDPVLSLGFTANTEFWIKNASPTPREVIFDTDIEFIGSPLIPKNGLAILKLIEVVGGVEYWSVNVIAENTEIVFTQEENGAIHRKDVSYTDEGNFSVNLSVDGAASGENSFSSGNGVSVGDFSTSSSAGAAIGNYSNASGFGVFSNSFSETAVGTYNENISPISQINYEANDLAFSIGIGQDGFRLTSFASYKNGGFKIVSRALSNITNAVKGFFAFDENARPNVHNGIIWNPLAYLSDLPFANIQTSDFTAVNLVAYSTNGTLTVTDPTPEANKGYIVHVIGGTTTIGGVGYTAGALVYRFYDGTAWTSIEYAKKSDLLKTVMFQNSNYTLDDSSGTTQKIFNIGSSGNGSFPITNGITYEFKLLLFLEELLSTTQLSFAMLGDVGNTSNVKYQSLSVFDNDIGEPDYQGLVDARVGTSFSDSLINNTINNTGKASAVIEGTFTATDNGYLIPAINVEQMSGGDKVSRGTSFTVIPIMTSSNIV